MKIIRNGNEYELTWQEMREAYVAMKREYVKEDIKDRAEQMDIALSEDDIEKIADDAENGLDNNDSMWDSYWMTIEYAIKNYNNRKIKLGNALFEKCHAMQNDGVLDIKTYEIVFQDIIEEFFPDKSWWEVTDCDVFTHLLEYKDPEKTIIEIIKGLKEECK